MIHRFSATNFCSFEETVEIDFRVDENAPGEDSYFNKGNGRVSLVEAIIGPNATGKTTALKALAFLQWLIVDSFRQDRYRLPFMQFAGHKDSSLPTELMVEFEMEQGVHVYTIVMSRSSVLSETLYVRNLTRERTTQKKLFSRYWNEEAEKFDVEDLAFGLPEKYLNDMDLKNTSVLAAASRLGSQYAKEINRYWRCLETNVEIEDRFMPSAYRAYGALNYYEEHDMARKRAEKDVRRYADLGIESFGKNGLIKHKFGDSTFDLEFENESSGTQQYIALRRMMDRALDKGGIVVVDEFDAFLHPEMFQSLVSKFLDAKVNKGHAQLILSAHDILILKSLEKDQINLTKKNERGATSITRLDAVKRGIRRDDNYFTNYLKDVYKHQPTILED